MAEIVAVALVTAAGGALLLLLPFAVHRILLLRAASRVGSGAPAAIPTHRLPRVTVQLPVYNEPRVVERLIDAAARLEYRADRLEIQLLDDSSDETSDLARARVDHWKRRGVTIEHVRRGNRSGYKAGALAHGLRRAGGEFILILDADFIPPPDLISRLLPPFRDPRVGMVQARWDHLNEEENALTRAQALLLDGHFFLEHGGRMASGHFLNFNGTAGIWRRAAIDEAGGWQADTLTEDLDLSYRAQMRGWRFVFLPGVGVPAELPENAPSLEGQQKRWAQGGIQTARKILPSLLRGPHGAGIKAEATAHLLGHLAHPLTLLLGVLILPSAIARSFLGLERFLVLDLLAFAAATLPFLVFYSVAGRRRGRPWRRLLPRVPLTLAVGVGLGAVVTPAVVRGLTGRRTPFHRTPKEGTGPVRRAGPLPVPGAGRWDLPLRVSLTLWMAICLVAAVVEGYLASLPFILLFLSGYGLLTWSDLVRRLGSEARRGRFQGSAGVVAPEIRTLEAAAGRSATPSAVPGPRLAADERHADGRRYGGVGG